MGSAEAGVLTVSIAERAGVETARAFVRTHPLVAFFVLAYGLSWAAWTPYVLSANGVGIWTLRFPTILGTGQLAGIAPGAYLGPLGSAFVVTAVADGRAGLRVWRDRLLRWRADAGTPSPCSASPSW